MHKCRFSSLKETDYVDICQNVSELMQPLVPEAAIPEVSRYFVESFGNRRRIDYGTGHEANFMAWL